MRYLIKLRILLLSNYLYILILVFALIYSIIFIKNYQHVSKISEEIKSFEGIVTNYKIDGNSLALEISTVEKLKVNYIISSLEEKEYLLQNIKFGIKVNFSGELNKPINNTIPNTFNYKKYLEYNKIYWILNAKELTIIDDKTNLFYSIKNFIVDRMRKSEKSSNYLEMLIIGIKANIDQDVNLNYQKNGISHLFALSGMHVSLFSSIILKFLKKLKINEDRSYIITTIFIIFYASITGFPASILISSILFCLLSLNKIFYTHISNLKLLILTGCIILLINPFLIYDLGFQFSFTTTFSLALASDKLNSKNYIIGLIKVSIVAFLFSIPVALNNFYELNLFGVINNLVFVPLITIVLYPLSLLCFIFPILDSIMAFFIFITENLNNLASKINYFTISVPKMSLFLSFLFYLSLIIFLTKKKISIVVSLLILIYLKIAPYFDPNYYVYYVDVGQGDLSLLRYAYNKEILLIDTGGRMAYKLEDWEKKNKNYNISDNFIVFLKSIGITKIDNLVLTHGDEDHVGETLNIIDKIKVENIIINSGTINNNEQEIIDNFNSVKVEEIISKYNISQINRYHFDDENENSQVLLININNFNFLFMGDTGHPVEKRLVEENNLPKIDFLKLGHHGSKNSNSLEFLKYVNPNYAIISAGRNNRYNHPSPIVTKYLDELNINQFNTQKNGTIEIKIRDNAYTYSYNPP